MNTTKSGIKYKFGDVLLAFVQFVDTNELKIRPVLVLFEEYGNIITAGITSNPHMKGIPLTLKEGMARDSIIKLNYIMTISQDAIKTQLLTISDDKKKIIKDYLMQKLD